MQSEEVQRQQLEEALPTSSHIITVPFPSAQAPTRLIAHLTLFKGPSVLLWCGECAEGWTRSNAEGSDLPDRLSSSLLIEQHQAPRPSAALLPPSGLLASELAVAMTDPRTKSTHSTSLFRSNADISKSMSERLSKRFSLAQIFLSLSLPDRLFSALEGGIEGSKVILLIEGALSDILKETLSIR